MYWLLLPVDMLANCDILALSTTEKNQMPQFEMNDDNAEFSALPEITQGYLEAMFFTENGGSLRLEGYNRL